MIRVQPNQSVTQHHANVVVYELPADLWNADLKGSIDGLISVEVRRGENTLEASEVKPKAPTPGPQPVYVQVSGGSVGGTYSIIRTATTRSGFKEVRRLGFTVRVE